MTHLHHVSLSQRVLEEALITKEQAVEVSARAIAKLFGSERGMGPATDEFGYSA